MKINKWLAIVLGLNILLRFPSLYDPVYYGDECIYLTLGQAFNKGLVFYRDIHDNKPPFLYLMAALAGGKQIWFRVITIFWTTVNVWLIYLLAKKVLKKERLNLLAALLFTVFSILPEGRIPNGENYMILPMTLAVLLIYAKKSWLLTGAAISAGFLFKIPVAFDFVAIGLAWFVFKAKNIRNVFKEFTHKNLYLYALGFFLPIILSVIYYASKGSFEPYVRSALMQNIGYLSSWSRSGESSSFLIQNKGLLIRGLIMLIITAALYFRRKKLGFDFTFFSLWFTYALFGVLLSERPYPHYLIQLVPSASILLLLLVKKLSWEKVAVTAFLTFLLIFSHQYYHFWNYPIIPYYQNFFRFINKNINKEKYFSFFDQKVSTDYKLAQYIKNHSEADERVFVWGDAACIYTLSERTPPGRYIVNYHIFDFNGYDETMQAIQEHKPNIILKLRNEKRAFPQLDTYLEKYYLLNRDSFSEAQIFHRIFQEL